MKASKEEARKARKALHAVEHQLVSVGRRAQVSEHLETISNFLDVAEKKLPSHAAYAADAKRKRKKKALT